MNCRFCNTELKHLFISLGSTPLSNSYLAKDDLQGSEPSYPLDVYICSSCFLVQLPEFESPDNIFSDYAYFSSYSQTWLDHACAYVSKMVADFNINKSCFVVELASNDGYLLQYFLKQGIPVLGIEPAENVAKVARQKGIPTESIFFGTATARQLSKQGRRPDLLLGNNVLAHVPNLNDFVMGMKIYLAYSGIITMEFPHLMKLIEGVQFDTIYHEHFSYFSFLSVEQVFSKHGLLIFDVEELPTHGGSLRIYARHKENQDRPISDRVLKMISRELDAGYKDLNYYLGFAEKVKGLKQEIVNFLIKAKDKGEKVVGYGAPAKGNTLLNYCGIKSDLIDYTVDKNPYKQGRYLPGSRIVIQAPDKIKETRPDYVMILPWNIKDEIMEQLDYIRQWGGRFFIPIPKPEVV